MTYYTRTIPTATEEEYATASLEIMPGDNVEFQCSCQLQRVIDLSRQLVRVGEITSEARDGDVVAAAKMTKKEYEKVREATDPSVCYLTYFTQSRWRMVLPLAFESEARRMYSLHQWVREVDPPEHWRDDCQIKPNLIAVVDDCLGVSMSTHLTSYRHAGSLARNEGC